MIIIIILIYLGVLHPYMVVHYLVAMLVLLHTYSYSFLIFDMCTYLPTMRLSRLGHCPLHLEDLCLFIQKGLQCYQYLSYILITFVLPLIANDVCNYSI